MNNQPTPRTNASKTKAIKNGFSQLIYYCYANDMAKLECELTAVTDQRDRLAKALQKLADCDWVITLPDRMDAVRAIANEALNQPNL